MLALSVSVKRLIRCIGYMILLGTSLTSSIAFAMPSEKPLMVIRLNQEHIHFEDSLQRVIDKVHSIDPQAHFTLKAIAPLQENTAPDAVSDPLLEYYLPRVIGALEHFGVDRKHIVVEHAAAALSDSEIHLDVFN